MYSHLTPSVHATASGPALGSSGTAKEAARARALGHQRARAGSTSYAVPEDPSAGPEPFASTDRVEHT